MGALPPVFIEFLGRSTGFMTTAKGVKTELASVEREGGGNMAKMGGVAKAALLGIGVAAGVVAVKTAHMAADFQTQMTRVRTGAGESAKNMSLVGDGVLAMAGKVGESTKDLTAGLYMVESAGFHGQNALDVLRVSAQGAKVGAADLATVTDAVTTAMNAYNLQSSNVAKNTQNTTDVMNALVGTEAEGKTNLEALAGSMSGILPVAAAAHVKLNEVLGAMATMTSQGTDARVSATYLRQTIGQLSNPSAKAATTMKGLGLNANAVSKELGSKGLAATLNTLTDAIKNKMGPGGDVFIKTLEKASKSSKDFQGELNKASGAKKTYIGALSTMVGGTKSMMGALMLTGSHMDTFKKNVDGIGKHVKEGGKSVEGWADVQKTFNQRMAEFKGTAEAIGIKIGQSLLPAFTQFVGALVDGVGWLTKHKDVVIAVGGAIGGVLTYGLYAAAGAALVFADAMLMNPVTYIVLGVMALGAAIALLFTHWKSVSSWLSGAWHTVVQGLGTAWHWLADQTMSTWHTIENLVTVAWRAVANFFSSAWHTVTDPIVKAWHWVANATSTVWNAIAGFFRKWWPLLLIIFAPFVALLVALWNRFHTTVWNKVKSTWSAVAGFLSGTWDGIKSVAKSVWASVQRNIVNPVMSVWRKLVSVWDAVSSYLGGKWSDIKAVALITWLEIKKSMIDPITGAWHTITKTMGDIKDTISKKLNDAWSAVKNIGSKFLSIGTAIVQGIITGIKNKVGDLFSSLGGLAEDALAHAKAALHVNSPSKKFRDQVGKAIPEGIAAGVRQNAGMAHAAVRETAGDMVTHFKGALGINSPSKVFRQLGIWVNQGLVDGLTGSLSQVKSAIKKTETELIQARNRLADMLGTKAGKGHSGWIKAHEAAISHLESYVKQEGVQLEKLAKQRDSVAKRLKAAQSHLKDIQKEWTSERDSIASGIMQGASVVMQAQADGAVLTTGDVLANMQNQMQAAVQFANELKELKKRGLSSSLIEQLASAGVDQGGATAQALMGANGSQIAQLNNMQSTLTSSAKSTGAVVADSMYGAGINAAKGLVRGLQSQEKAIDKQMLKIAKSMETAIKRALGIKSPSRLFHQIGQFITAGLVGGIDSGNRDVQSAAARMSDAVIRGSDAPTLSGSAIGSTAAGVVHMVHIEVHGSVRTDQDLRDVIQREMYRFGGRNSRTWVEAKR
jgi:TP901 family phage tail tape measure protein